MADADRISQLSDDVLHEILSWLPDTKLRAQTSLLAKRWRHLWTQHPTINLTFTDHRQQAYIDGVDKSLAAYQAPVLQRLRISVCCVESTDRWIRLAGLRSVRELHIARNALLKLPLPSSFFSSLSALSVLHLSRCKFFTVPSSFRGFTSLTSLTLSKITADDQALADLLSKCPSLESLNIYGLLNLNHLIVSSKTHPKLKHLAIRSTAGGFRLIEIDAPDLQTVTFNVHRERLRLTHSPSLVEATILEEGSHRFFFYPLERTDDSMRLVPAVSEVELLHVNDWFFLHYLHLDPIVFKNLRRLHCDVYCLSGRMVEGLVSFLVGCPSLEEFHINLVCGNREIIHSIREKIKSTNPMVASSTEIPLLMRFLYTDLENIRNLSDDLPEYLEESFKNSVKPLKKIVMKGYMCTKNEAWLKSMLEHNVSSEKLAITYLLGRNMEETRKLLQPFVEDCCDIFRLIGETNEC